MKILKISTNLFNCKTVRLLYLKSKTATLRRFSVTRNLSSKL